jgi:hypothetical protein
LLADGQGGRMQPGAGASGQDDAFAWQGHAAPLFIDSKAKILADAQVRYAKGHDPQAPGHGTPVFSILF